MSVTTQPDTTSTTPAAGRCLDHRCTEGIVDCGECNAWGRTSPKGGRYRLKCKAIPAWAIDCAPCHGTGMVACGCVALGPAERAVIEGRGAEYLAGIELDAIEAGRG